MAVSPESVLVVVSCYDARPQHELDSLLQDLATVPAGWAFSVVVVVNQTRAEPPPVRGDLPGLRVLLRPNAGYNIGAWEHGWRSAPGHDVYVFLQQECRIRRPGWLSPFVVRLRDPGVGLVGERKNPTWDRPWPEIERQFAGHTLSDHQVDGVPADRLTTYRHFFARHGIDAGGRGDHLQTLMLAATGATLRRIGGFPVGRDYGESIAAEIAVSKRVQMAGLLVEEIGPRPFTWITHPQWQDRDVAAPPPPRLGLGSWLEQVRARYRDQPWLLLGKGPTFAQLSDEHRRTHRLFGLNHVVRQERLTLAHAIDIDVVRSCADQLAGNCEFLLMPRVPHVDQAAGTRLLEEFFAEIPQLWELERQGRLVWYNCSTGRPHAGSPVIEVQCFSSEAALGILAAMGVRTVRSLGVDGGRQYAGSFADLAGTTRLQNGQPLFDKQFRHLARIVRRHGLDYAPLTTARRVDVVGGPRLHVAAKVTEFTLRKQAMVPIEVVHLGERAAAPAGAVVVEAGSLAIGPPPAAGGAAADWLMPAAGEPWLRPADPAAATWLDAFAEAVNAGFVSRAEVARAVRRGDVDARLLQLSALPVGPVADPARALQRELAQMRLSRTWAIGSALARPAVAMQRLLWRRVQ